MELQWPLILFTSFLSASAGLFCVQGIYALTGKGQKAQMPATIVSVALLVIGGIAVCFHLQHWERIFNGFGHITSGITQELIAIVVVAVLMVLFLGMLHRGSSIPKWLAALAIIGSVALLFVMGHSYMMASRPAWDTIAQPLSLFGAAAAIGVGIFGALSAGDEDAAASTGIWAISGTGLGLALTAIYVVAMSFATNRFVDVGQYLDPTHPAAAMVDPALLSPFASGSMGPTIGAIVLSALALALAIAGYRSKKWATLGWAIAGCAFVSAILLRVAFYNVGGSVFLFY